MALNFANVFLKTTSNGWKILFQLSHLCITSTITCHWTHTSFNVTKPSILEGDTASLCKYAPVHFSFAIFFPEFHHTVWNELSMVPLTTCCPSSVTGYRSSVTCRNFWNTRIIQGVTSTSARRSFIINLQSFRKLNYHCFPFIWCFISALSIIIS